MKRFISWCASLSFLCTGISHAAILNIDPASVPAAAWTIFDPQSGQTIAEFNSHAQRAPASLTKMMVAYITLKEIKAGKLKRTDILTANDVVKVVQPDESQMFLRPGQQISIDQLLTGLVVMSANDAAVTLAQRIGGDLPHFVEMMNQEAKALGMTDTHFTNPAGITMDGHYSSAADMAKLGNALIQQYPDYLYYSKQTIYSWNNHAHHATNILLTQDPTVDGLKTGFTRAAGFNLALTAKRQNMNPDLPERRLIVVVMGTTSPVMRAEVAHRLMNLAYNYTRDDVVLKAKQPIAELPVLSGQIKRYTIVPEQNKIITTSLYNQPVAINMGSFDSNSGFLKLNGQLLQPITDTKTTLQVQLKQQQLTAPLNQTMQLATLKIYQNNQWVEDVNIDNNPQLQQASVWERFWTWIKHILPFFKDAVLPAKIFPLG
ncbi:D-alanyl-D-alanine carboxypeptidase family protein [Acinetobacter sp. MD2(2019)]|uniref:D-alanyl-D-alanine carboxypeptidase family protein n=1 Tax=Acinetobacter sp. MD2(2019) TaxID=2605273 RepID=UPI002D1E582E|nr:D-alanyl-D-alanine carboxypeptidase family protein [Acinetobacter sp. MD2(2019)]MEB3754088.1 D-alanyl-D-alanine carboxypeptidase [Acinetobacter sp. MD2(2019)]